MTADPPVPIRCTVNGREHRLEVGPDETLLRTLRERLRLTGTKEGCIEGECGACTVLLDDLPVASCILVAAVADGRRVRTVEGLAAGERLSALQRAFVAHGAVQCGFCTPGFLMTMTALLERHPSPSRDQVETALAGNICRCTGYRQMVDAVLAAAGETRA